VQSSLPNLTFSSLQNALKMATHGMHYAC